MSMELQFYIYMRSNGAQVHSFARSLALCWSMRLCVSFVYCYNQCQSVCAFEHLHAISIFENVLFPLFSIFNRINFVLILQTVLVALAAYIYIYICLSLCLCMLWQSDGSAFLRLCFCLRHTKQLKAMLIMEETVLNQRT